ncbi:MAG: HTH domain-containing protein [Bacteroidota bacterium]
MRFIDYRNKLVRLHQLINRKGTGDPAALARRLDISRASVFRYLNDLKDMGADIRYCKNRQSYQYEDNNTPDFKGEGI